MDDLDPSKLSDRELLVSTYTNVKNLDKKLEGHIADDKELKEKVIIPLWTKHQQDIGEAKVVSIGGKVAGFFITTIISVFTTIIAVKAMKP